MKRQKREYIERSVYFFKCSKRGRKQSRTFYKRIRTAGICRKCRKNQVNENQLAMFEPLKNQNGEVNEMIKKHDEAIIKATTAKL